MNTDPHQRHFVSPVGPDIGNVVVPEGVAFSHSVPVTLFVFDDRRITAKTSTPDQTDVHAVFQGRMAPVIQDVLQDLGLGAGCKFVRLSPVWPVPLSGLPYEHVIMTAGWDCNPVVFM